MQWHQRLRVECVVRVCKYARQRRAAASWLSPASLCRVSQSFDHLQVGQEHFAPLQLHCPAHSCPLQMFPHKRGSVTLWKHCYGFGNLLQKCDLMCASVERRLLGPWFLTRAGRSCST